MIRALSIESDSSAPAFSEAAFSESRTQKLARDDPELTHAHCVRTRITLTRRSAACPRDNHPAQQRGSHQNLPHVARLKRDPSHPGDKRAASCIALSASMSHCAVSIKYFQRFSICNVMCNIIVTTGILIRGRFSSLRQLERAQPSARQGRALNCDVSSARTRALGAYM